MAEPDRPDLSSPLAVPSPFAEPFQPTAEAVTRVGQVELREERAFVGKRREHVGRVLVGKEVERRTETLTLDLTQEAIYIETRSGASGVFVDGQPLMEGQRLEVTFEVERAEVVKRVVIAEEVAVGKRAVTTRETFTVDLAREVLDVARTDVLPAHAPAFTRPASTHTEEENV